MATRMLRDCTDSERVNKLSYPSEVFFYRLMMKADDYGSFHANVKLIKASLFPLRLDTIREADISRWMAECQKAGLIVIYTNAEKQYLRIINFGQRLRNKNKKFPDCPADLLTISGELPQLAANGGELPPEVEVEVEVEKEKEKKKADKPPSPKISFEDRLENFRQELLSFVKTYGEPAVEAFYIYWQEPNKARSKMKWETEDTWNTNLRLKRWVAHDFNKKGKTAATTTETKTIR